MAIFPHTIDLFMNIWHSIWLRWWNVFNVFSTHCLCEFFFTAWRFTHAKFWLYFFGDLILHCCACLRLKLFISLSICTCQLFFRKHCELFTLLSLLKMISDRMKSRCYGFTHMKSKMFFIFFFEIEEYM